MIAAAAGIIVAEAAEALEAEPTAPVWDLLAIAADAAEDVGDEALAAGLRWCITYRKRPNKMPEHPWFWTNEDQNGLSLAYPRWSPGKVSRRLFDKLQGELENIVSWGGWEGKNESYAYYLTLESSLRDLGRAVLEGGW